MLDRLLNSRWRIIICGILITTLPLLCIATFVLSSVTTALERQSLERRATVAFMVARLLETQLQGAINLGRQCSAQPSLITALQAGDARGMELNLRKLVASSQHIERAFVASTKGMLLSGYPRDPSVVGKNYSDRDWYRGVSREQSPYIYEYYLRDIHPRRYVFAISMPIRATDGHVVGILVMHPEVDFAKAVIDSISQAKGTTYLLDNKGHVIYNPKSKADEQTDFSGLSFFGKLQKGLAGTEKSLDPVNGEKVIAAYHPVANSGWGVVTESPVAEVLAPARKVATGIYLFTGFMLLISLFLGYRWAEMLSESRSLVSKLAEKEFFEKAQNDLLTTLNNYAENPEEQVAAVLQKLSLHAHLDAALLYVIQEDKLQACAAHLAEKPSGADELARQCLNRRTLTRVTDLRDIRRMATGLGERMASEVIALPLIFKETPLGVLELASLSGFTEADLYVIKRIAPRLAIGISSIRDAIALKETADKLACSNEELEAMNLELQSMNAAFQAMNQKLQEQQRELQESNRRLEGLSRTKSEFLANMSHEIRTPLNAIIGFSDLALKTSLTPKQLDYLKKIYNSGESLLGVINDILDFSKIEANRMELERIEFPLEAVLSQVISVIQQKAAEKGIEFLLSHAPEVPAYLIGDPLRLGQVLINLLGNAVKFTDSGEVELSIDLVGESHVDLQVCFTVRDTGIGITAEQIQTLFQPFTQADGTTTRRFGGTGLGLSISERLVEMMGGGIRVASVDGKGSSFSFTATFARATTPADPWVIPEIIRSLRILIVDDSQVSNMALKKLLRFLPVEVETVDSGAQALEAVWVHDAVSPYHLVIINWHMPDMDGVQTIRTIKKDSSLQNSPQVIMLSAFGQERERAEALAAGADEFLYRPMTHSDIYHLIIRLFAPGQFAAATGAKSAAREGYDFAGLKLLVVEDNELNRQIACELLEMAGATVAVAGNGREAVEMVASGSFDVVLMDIQMPEMDGIQATRLIRKDSRFSGLPIIALTAHAFAEERQRTQDAGMNDHVTKPIEPRKLMEAICRQLPQLSGLRGEAGNTGAEIPEVTALVDIPGIDTASALRRVGGKVKLYLDVLRKFRDGQGNAAERITAALQSGDRLGAERLAHTLKGLAGTVGAVELQEVALAVEQDLHRGIEPGDNLARLAASLRGTMATLESSLKKENLSPVTFATAPIPLVEVEAMLKKLEQYLLNSDSEAADYLAQCRPLLTAVVAKERVVCLEKQLAGYDFDEALATVRTMMS